MGIIREQPTSGKIQFDDKSASADFSFYLTGYSSTWTALDALISYAPLVQVVRNKLLAYPQYDVQPVITVDATSSQYTGTVTYTTSDQTNNEEEPDTGDDASFSFGFSTLTDVKLTTTSQQTYHNNTGVPTQNKETAINRHHPELPPEGVEYLTPIATMTGKCVIPAAVATNLWFRYRLEQVYTLNNAIFRGLPINSVMFTGMTGSRRTDGNWDITYNFEFRPDKAGTTFGHVTSETGITIPSTGGWQLLWLEYADIKVTDIPQTEDDEGKSYRQVSKVHVADIYGTSNFAALGMVGV